MKRKHWYLKGVTGEMLAGLKEDGPHPFTVALVRSAAFIRSAGGLIPLSLTVRGNARDRRQAVRALERYLNGGRP